MQQALDQHHVHFGDPTHAVCTPAIRLWTGLWQGLSRARSGGAAVIRTAVLLVALKLPPWSEETGTYLRARAKLPAALLRQLALTVGPRVEDTAAADGLWQGRHASLLDGSSATLADTPANQRASPPSGAQQPGLGFPWRRFVVLRGLATAGGQDLAFGPHQGQATGEPALARPVFGRLRAGDGVVADRLFGSYGMVVRLRALGVEVVFRMPPCRSYDVRRGERLGREDPVVTWRRPKRPPWMTAAAYAAVPDQRVGRALHGRIPNPGYRTKAVVLVTTLWEGTAFPQTAMAALYQQRWQAELDRRSLKQTLGMDQLRSTTPEWLERELGMHVLAYNRVRQVMAQAALGAREHRRRRPLRHRSVAGAKVWTPRGFRFSGAVEQGMAWWHEHTTGPAETQPAR